MPSLSPEARAAAKELVAAGRLCEDCGGIHARACPRISKIHVILNRDGAVVDRAVEYWPPGTWEAGVLFPEAVHDDSGDEDEPGAGG